MGYGIQGQGQFGLLTELDQFNDSQAQLVIGERTLRCQCRQVSDQLLVGVLSPNPRNFPAGYF